MAIAPGTTLGPYEILASVGRGGMGEVYRARDTRLKREVAVKVLPQHVMSDASKRPQPSALFDVGSQDDIEFLVMEYLEGDTESSLEPLAWSGDSLSLH